jgi:hypothetical protein
MTMNWKAIGIWAVAIGAVVGLCFAGGCRLDEIITVDVPPEVQESTGVGPKVTLRDAPQVREKHIFNFTQGLDRFDENYADSSLLYEIASSALNSGAQIAVPALGEVPGGAILVGLLGGLGGLFLKRPGEGKAIKSAEDAGYDMGRAETLNSLREATNGNPTA